MKDRRAEPESVDGRRAKTPPGFECWGVYSRDCATRRTLARVADKWTILIVGRLMQRPCRFGELKRSIEGLSSKVLTDHLRALEADGLLTRTVTPTSPPAVTYALTSLGAELGQIALALKDWAEIHAARMPESASR
ncbi:MAG: helix-turn-helix domain-containing protein [Pseudomonadota bacterium]